MPECQHARVVRSDARICFFDRLIHDFDGGIQVAVEGLLEVQHRGFVGEEEHAIVNRINHAPFAFSGDDFLFFRFLRYKKICRLR